MLWAISKVLYDLCMSVGYKYNVLSSGPEVKCSIPSVQLWLQTEYSTLWAKFEIFPAFCTTVVTNGILYALG
jgi:hypothetical protein